MPETLDEFLSWQSPDRTEDVISDGILVPQSRLIIFGNPKSWKSGLALYTATCIATGRPWFGHKTTKSLPYLYQVELPKYAFQLRTRKFFTYENGLRPQIMFENAVRLKLDTSYGANALEKDIASIHNSYPDQHIVLILDNIYKCMSGHISDPKDTERLLDNIDELKDRHKITAILIHHTRLSHFDSDGKIIDAGAEDAMGSSYFNNWCDTMLRLKLLDPPPFGAGTTVKADFLLARNADKYLSGFKIRWSRTTLHPHLVSVDPVPIEDADDISIRGVY